MLTALTIGTTRITMRMIRAGAKSAAATSKSRRARTETRRRAAPEVVTPDAALVLNTVISYFSRAI
ncbi:hypothetical protein GCM10023068_10740 [Leifsonia shinshuensis]